MTVRQGNRLNPCQTVAMRGFVAVAPVSALTKRTFPPVGAISPRIVSSSVLFPQPLGPMIAVTRRGSMRKLTLWSASTGAPDLVLYVRLTPSHSIATPASICFWLT